jgi:hypothetical protein
MGVMKDLVLDEQPNSRSALDRRLALDALRPDALARLAVISVADSDDEIRGLSSDALPALAVPHDQAIDQSPAPHRILVAAEGADRKLADAIAAVLDPGRVALAVVHVTWVPGIASSPLPEGGIDQPEQIDLLLYRGASEALIDTADALRRAGFAVSTHLREHHQPAVALLQEIERERPALVLLGLGRHGAGIGRDLLREARIPVLYVDAR